MFLSPVPLNVESGSILNLNVININNKREVKLKYEVSKPNSELFTVEFFKGNLIPGLSNINIPVKIIFRSTHPVSVREQVSENLRFCNALA